MARTAALYTLALIACSSSGTPSEMPAASTGTAAGGAQQAPVGMAGVVAPAPGSAGMRSPGASVAGTTSAPVVTAAGTNASAGTAGTRMPMAGMTSAANSGADAGPAETPDDDNCSIGKFKGQKPVALTASGDSAAHDPTMIEFQGTYYRYWTGDRVPVATSTDLMSWKDVQPVYRNGYPQWSKDWLAGIQGQTFNFPWAPDASHFGDQYHLYSAFSAKFGDNISCITHLTTNDIGADNWTDHGPVICSKGNENYNAIDPEVGLDLDGTPYLAFGSFWDGIFAFKLNDKGERVGTDLTRLASAKEIEGPVMFHRCGYYYLLVSFGLCCPGNNRTVDQLTYRVAVGRSKNIMGPYVDKSGKSMVEGGGTVIVQGDSTFAAAGHSDVLISKGHFYHLYHAYRRPSGRAEFRVIEMLFDDDGWPVAAAP